MSPDTLPATSIATFRPNEEGDSTETAEENDVDA